MKLCGFLKHLEELARAHSYPKAVLFIKLVGIGGTCPFRGFPPQSALSELHSSYLVIVEWDKSFLCFVGARGLNPVDK